MTAFPEQGFEILNKKQLDSIMSLLRFCITNDYFQFLDGATESHWVG